MSASAQQHSDSSQYVGIFGILISLTILTVTLSYVNVGEAVGLPQVGRAANIFAGLLVAAIKSSLVFWIFMHMNHETRVNRFIFGFALSLMLLFFFVTSCEFVWLGTYVVNFARAAVGGM